MRIGGFQKFSLIDYPGRTCAVVFTQGCNFRCPYCHNPELVKPELFFESIPEEDVLEFLGRREGKLDGVTVTGGEPTLQPSLIKFLQRLKNMNFLVKLDTNGSHPEILEKAIELKLLDFIAMDIKAPLEIYSQVVCAPIDNGRISRSVDLIRQSGVPYQFRTTVVRSLLRLRDLEEIVEWMADKAHIFQPFVASKLLNPEIAEYERSLVSQDARTQASKRAPVAVA